MEPSSTLTPAEAEAARKAEEATRVLAARFDAEAEAARVEPLDASQLEWARAVRAGHVHRLLLPEDQLGGDVPATEINPEARFFCLSTRTSSFPRPTKPGPAGRAFRSRVRALA